MLRENMMWFVARPRLQIRLCLVLGLRLWASLTFLTNRYETIYHVTIERIWKRTYFFHTFINSILLILRNQCIQQQCLAHSKQILSVLPSFSPNLIRAGQYYRIRSILHWRTLDSLWVLLCRVHPKLPKPAAEPRALRIGDTPQSFFPGAATMPWVTWVGGIGAGCLRGAAESTFICAPSNLLPSSPPFPSQDCGSGLIRHGTPYHGEHERPHLPISPKMNLKNNVRLKKKKQIMENTYSVLPRASRRHLSSVPDARAVGLRGWRCTTSSTAITRELRNPELWPHCRLTESLR